MQKTIKYFKYFLWPILAIASIIEAVSNVRFIPKLFTYWGTIAIILFWIGIETYARTKGIPWKGNFGKNLKVTRPSSYIRISFLGLLFVLWIPFFIGDINDNDELEEYKEHVEIILLSKETGLSEERLKETLTSLWGDNYLEKLKDENFFQNLRSSIKGRTLVQILDELKNYEKITYYDPELKSKVYNLLYNFRFEEAMKLLDTYIQEHPNLRRENSAQIEYLRSIVFNVKGDYFGREKSLRAAIALDNDNPDLNYEYGLSLNFIGENKDALEYFKKAHQGYSKVETENSSKLALAAFWIGVVYKDFGEDDLAIYYLDKALEYGDDIYDKDYEYHKVYQLKALVFIKRKEFNRAEKLLEKSKKITLKNYSSPSYELGKLYIEYGILWSDRGNIKLAIDYYNLALSEVTQTMGSNHPTIADIHHNIAIEFLKIPSTYNFEKAMNHYDKAIKITRKTLGEDHFKLALSYKDKGFLYAKMNNFVEADKYYNKALIIMIKSLPENHFEIKRLKKMIRENKWQQ